MPLFNVLFLHGKYLAEFVMEPDPKQRAAWLNTQICRTADGGTWGVCWEEDNPHVYQVEHGIKTIKLNCGKPNELFRRFQQAALDCGYQMIVASE